MLGIILNSVGRMVGRAAIYAGLSGGEEKAAPPVLRHISIDGVEKAIAQLDGLDEQFYEAFLEAMRDEQDLLLRVAQEYVPIETETLLNSALAYPLIEDGTKVIAKVSFGEGVGDARAVVMHENLEYTADPGSPRGPKYLTPRKR